MNTSRTVEVEVYNRDQYDSDDWPPSDLTGFIAWFQAKLDSVPAECRSTAQVERGMRGYPGDTEPYIVITYRRPLTSEEVEADRLLAEQTHERNEAHERAELARLLAKFGTPT